MDELGRSRVRPTLRELTSSTVTSWHLNTQQGDNDAVSAGFPNDLLQPLPFDFYDDALNIYYNNVALPLVPHTQNNNENPLEYSIQGINALNSPFQLKTPSNINHIIGNLDVTSGFDISSQTFQNSNKLKCKVIQLQIELANVIGNVASLQSK